MGMRWYIQVERNGRSFRLFRNFVTDSWEGTHDGALNRCKLIVNGGCVAEYMPENGDNEFTMPELAPILATLSLNDYEEDEDD